VTLNARTAIGLRRADGWMPKPGDVADFVILHDNESLHSAVLNPSYARTTIKGGTIVAKRHALRWIRAARGDSVP